VRINLKKEVKILLFPHLPFYLKKKKEKPTEANDTSQHYSQQAIFSGSSNATTRRTSRDEIPFPEKKRQRHLLFPPHWSQLLRLQKGENEANFIHPTFLTKRWNSKSRRMRPRPSPGKVACLSACRSDT